MLKFVIDNDLISPNEYSIKPADSCVNQLLSIAHDIYKLDCGYEVRCFS